MKLLWMAVLFGLLSATGFAEDADKKAEPYRKALLALINEARFAQGYPPLEIQSAAEMLAQRWAESLAQQSTLEHRSRTMLKEAMIKNKWLGISENLHASPDGNQPKACFDSWMGSDVHRGNLLRATTRAAGIGLALGKDGQYYVVFNGVTKR